MPPRTTFPPDEVELAVPDAATADALLTERDPSFQRYVGQRRARFEKLFGAEDHKELLDRAEQALRIAYARFALRHGTWGEDLHDYHNESHAVEILSGRIDYLCDRAGPERLPPRDWVLLTLFGAMHDLRQREKPDPDRLVGANESASIEECHRILDAVGFDREADKATYADLEMMIAGSTFNTAPKKNPNVTPAEAATSAGALAPLLVLRLDQEKPNWRDDPELRHRVRLTLISSDLDTANVSEPILKFSKSAVRLCKEIEYRCGRDLGNESAVPVFNFLTKGQEAYFFDLHQFDSELGTEVLGAMKEKNAPVVTALVEHMREKYAGGPGDDVTGREIIDEFMHKASELSGRAARR